MEVKPTKMSTAKKVALGISATAAIGATAYATMKGKKIAGDSFEKSVRGYAEAAKVGYKEIGKLINEKAIQPALSYITAIYNDKVKPAAESITKKASDIKNNEQIAKIKEQADSAVNKVKASIEQIKEKTVENLDNAANDASV